MKPPSELRIHLGYWLRTLSNHVSKTFAARLEGHGVTVPQWVVLRTLLERAPCAQRALLEDIAGDKGALSRLVERLVERGLATRRINEENRREVVLNLTPKARKLIPLLAQEADANDREFFATLSPQQKEDFLGTIHSLIAANRSEDLGFPTD